MRNKEKNLLVFIGIFFFIISIVLIMADVSWNPGSHNITYNVTEDALYEHNLTKNVTDYNSSISIAIDTENNISWNGENYTKEEIENWIFLNESTSILTINATRDNETGFFEIPIQVSFGLDSSGKSFEFNISPVNDPPQFNGLVNTSFNMSDLFNPTINVTDEEDDTPYNLTINFISCDTAEWSTRNDVNCDLFNSSHYTFNNETGIFDLSFTPLRNDVGYYIINFTVIDYNSLGNQSTTKIINYTVLNINFRPYFRYSCDSERNQEEDTNILCWINVSDIDETNNLTITANYSWFVFNSSSSNTAIKNISNSTDYNASFLINFTPEDLQVGNWTINLTLADTGSPVRINSTEIWMFIDNIEDDVSLDAISDIQIYENYTFYLNATDDDLLVSDKTIKDETLTFRSNTSWVDIITTTHNSGTDYTTAEIKVDYGIIHNDSNGNYTVKINVTDTNLDSSEKVFTIEILGDTAVEWNASNYTFSYNESDAIYINLSEYVNDSEGDAITFSFTNDSVFSSFDLNSSTGIINFTPIDEDVGYHNITINASDGKLNSLKDFNFTIYNINDAPVIETPITSGTNISIGVNSSINVTEDKYTQIILYVRDNDFKIPSGQKSFYNESLNITTTILNSSNSIAISDLFNFSLSSTPTSDSNRSIYEATLIPLGEDIGSYNVTVNITDASNISDILEFNLTILSSNDAPVLMNLTNQTSVVNRTFYYDINATDEEDGNETLGNLTFSYDFINGTDFINNNQTIFNTTSGILNIIFNDTQAGIYRINITVNDSSSSEDFNDFWIYIYDPPNISNPSSLEIFNLTENETYNFNFTVNHSIEDNLTYLFYIDLITYNGSEFNYSDLILRENTNYYGNGTNLTWQFTPNFTDESYGKLKNLSLIVYPSNSNLTNAVLINSTLNLKLNISHANYPINFSGTIANQSKEKTKKIYIDLEDYFSSLDYDDAYYNRTVNFTILNSDTNLSPSGITSNFPYSNWTLSLASSSGVALEEDLFINSTEFDSNNNLLSSKYSNSFNTEFTEPSQTTTPPVGGGGGGSSIPVSFKIIHPGEIFVSQYEKVDIPLKLENKGSKAFQRINLVNTLLFNSTNSNQGIGSFDIDYFDFLKVGETKNFSLSLLFNTAILGEYEVMVNASSLTPRYNDGIKIKVHVQELNKSKVEEILIFTEEFITQNPECAEITEIVNEAKKHFEEGDLINAKLKAEEAVNACKDAISQVSIPKERKTKEQLLKDYLNYLILISFFAFIVGIVYYFIKRRAFIKKYKE